MNEPETLGEIISKKGVGNPRKKKQKLELLKAAWWSIVGEEAAEHSRPTRLSRGTLTVAADGSAWAAETSMKTEIIVRRSGELLGPGSISRVKVQARHGEPENRGKEPEEDTAGRVSEWQPTGKLADSLDKVDDGIMRDALIRLAKASKKTGKTEKKS